MKSYRFFTLLEVMITMMIMSVVAALIVSSFHTGLMCYQKINTAEQSSLTQIGVLSMLQLDVKRFVPVPGGEKFTSKEMVFNILDHDSGYRLKRVCYAISQETLTRTLEPYNSTAETAASMAPPAVLLKNAVRLSFSYMMPPDAPPNDASMHSGKASDPDKPNLPAPNMNDAQTDGKRETKTEAPTGSTAASYREPKWPLAIKLNGELSNNHSVTASIRMPLFQRVMLSAQMDQGNAQKNK